MFHCISFVHYDGEDHEVFTIRLCSWGLNKVGGIFPKTQHPLGIRFGVIPISCENPVPLRGPGTRSSPWEPRTPFQCCDRVRLHSIPTFPAGRDHNIGKGCGVPRDWNGFRDREVVPGSCTFFYANPLVPTRPYQLYLVPDSIRRTK